jgi:hypothetical protein
MPTCTVSPGGFGKVLQRRECLPPQVLAPDNRGAESVETQPQNIPGGSGVLGEEPEFLERMQDTENGGLAEVEFGSEFGQGPTFAPGKAIDHLQSLAEGAEKVGFVRLRFGGHRPTSF